VTKNPNSDQSYTLDLPVTTLVTEASIEKPNLGIGLAIDSLLLNDLLKRFTMPKSIEATHVVRGVSVSTASSELLDPTLRLMKLLERPNEIPALAPLITQEILYRLLSGSDGPRLLSIALSDSHGNRIAKALAWLRENFSKPLRIEELSERVGMSVSSFHHHFKIVTEGFRVPEGEVYVPIESPRGEQGCYLVSDGGPKPWRVHFRAPSFAALEATATCTHDALVADLIAIVGSLDAVMGDSDR